MDDIENRSFKAGKTKYCHIARVYNFWSLFNVRHMFILKGFISTGEVYQWWLLVDQLPFLAQFLHVSCHLKIGPFMD